MEEDLHTSFLTISTSTPTRQSNNSSHWFLMVPSIFRWTLCKGNLVTEIEGSISSSIAAFTLLICSDGSYDPYSSRGDHGWVFATAEQRLWKGARPMDEHSKPSDPLQRWIKLTSYWSPQPTLCLSTPLHRLRSGNTILWLFYIPKKTYYKYHMET